LKKKNIHHLVTSASVFNPLDINPDFWVKADQIPSANLRVSGLDSFVTKWDDLAAGRNLLQPIASKQPKYLTGSINGLPVVSFDGVDDFLERVIASTVFDNRTSGTIMAVFQYTAGSNFFFSSADEVTFNTNFFALRHGVFTVDNIFSQQKNNDAQDLVRGSTDISTFTNIQAAWMSTGSSYRYRVNRNEETKTVFLGSDNGDWFADTDNRENLILGALVTSTVTPGKADMAEFIIFGRELDTQDLNDMENYFDAKYNL